MFTAKIVGIIFIVAMVFGLTWGEEKDDYY